MGLLDFLFPDRLILRRLDDIMADTAATLAKLAEANARMDTVISEIQALKALVASGATPDEVAAAIDTLAGKVGIADELNP